LIIALNGALYVQGYRLEEGSVLPERPSTFLFHRILSVTPLQEYFRFDAADTEARRFGLQWHDPKFVAIEVDRDAADYVRDHTWSDDQRIDEREDWPNGEGQPSLVELELPQCGGHPLVSEGEFRRASKPS
jgi:hypothetical protein